MNTKKYYVALGLLILCMLFPLTVHADDPPDEKKEVAADAADNAAAVEEAPREGAPAEVERDPLETLNRAFFVFNDRLYFWVMKPTAKAYSFFVPEVGRVRVRNAFHNIEAPIRFVSSLLQLKMKSALFEVGSFALNSTFGLGGMFEVVKRPPDLRTDEDLGLAFGHYGVGEGFYIVWPLLGPSNLRDSVGMVGDGFLNPVNYITPWEDSAAVQAGGKVNNVSLKIGEYEDFKESAVDPYIAMKDAYSQYRRSKIKGESATPPAAP